MAVLIKYGFQELGWNIGKRKFGLTARKVSEPEVTETQPRGKRARNVRLVLEELGPTFIKFGQLLSTRPDLVPAEFITELEKLQDEVPAAKYEHIREVVKKELGSYPEVIFAEFDTECIAAGSIGEVHRARTKEGDDVVVKIRRPKIVQTILTECDILRDVAGIIKASFTDDDSTVDPHKMVDEFAAAVRKECDFDNERRNQKRFIMNFAEDPHIKVPAVFDDYCSEGVLTMEYAGGVKPRNRKVLSEAGLNPKLVSQRGADFVLKQVFEYGFFHTDPHPGNFFVLEDNILVPIDFGQVGILGTQEKRLLKDTVVSVVTLDAVQMVRALERSELMDSRTDMGSFVHEIEGLYNTYYNLPLKEIPFNDLMLQGFDIMRKHYIRPPADFTMMVKCLITVDSFARSLDPDFEIFEYLKPYAKRFSLEDIKPSSVIKNARKTALGAGNLIASMPDDVNALLSKFRQGKFQVRVHHEHLDTLNKTLDKSSNRLSFAVIIAALLIGSSLLVPQEGMALGVLHMQTLGIIGYIVAAIMGIWLLISILRGKSL